MKKFKKYPKKPSAKASVAVKERYLAKCKEVDAYNRAIVAEKKRSEQLDKQISGLLSVKRTGSFTTVSYLKKPKKKKAAVSGVKKRRKTTARKRK